MIFTINLLILLSISHCISCSRILVIFELPLYSHQEVFLPLIEQLSLRGHEVVAVTCFPLRNNSLTNLTEIDVSYLIEHNHVQSQLDKKQHFSDVVKGAASFIQFVTKKIYEDENFKKIYQNPNEHFDLVMTEIVYPAGFAAFGYKFKAPVIGLLSFHSLIHVNDITGNINIPQLYPDTIYSYESDINLFEKIFRIIYYVWFKYYCYTEVLPSQDKFIRQYMGDSLPYLGDIEDEISMTFLNFNPIVHEIRPHVPATLYLSQMHIKPIKKLPDVSYYLLLFLSF